jgi:predicted Holliday junction resolvase-like endonuclease
MEQLLAFVLGVFAVLAIASVLNMFKTASQIKDLRGELEQVKNELYALDMKIDERHELIDRRIDQEIDRVDEMTHKLYEYVDKLYQNHEDNLNELYRYVDSRTDKMADSMSKHISDIYENMNSK